MRPRGPGLRRRSFSNFCGSRRPAPNRRRPPACSGTPQALYVGFDAEDADINARFLQRDDPTYRDDAVEIFINPDPKQEAVYYGFEMNARGVLYDYLNYNSRTLFKRFDATGVKIATALRGTLNEPKDIDQRVEPRGRDSVGQLRGAVAPSARSGNGVEGECQPLGWRRAEPPNEHLVRSPEHDIVAARAVSFRRDSVRGLVRPMREL